MTTIEDFFKEVSEFKDRLDRRNTETIHTDWYEETAIELFADWRSARISLKPIVAPDVIERLDQSFTDLLNESRKARSKVSKSSHALRRIENEYVRHIYPEISHRSIETGFVNSLIAELEVIQNDKYHEYMEEAIQCVQAGAHRGAVVLGWQAAMYALYKALDSHNEPIHVAYQKKFGQPPKHDITDFWSFQKMNDQKILILAEAMDIIDKSLKDLLDKERDIRNKAAHPGEFDVGPNTTKAFLEKITQLLIHLHL